MKECKPLPRIMLSAPSAIPPPLISDTPARPLSTLTASPTSIILTDARSAGQGLTLVHFSAQLEPCLTQENTLYTLNTP